LSLFNTYKLLIKKYPAARVISSLLIIALALGLSLIIGHNSKKIPVIDYIDPSVGLPGEVLTIYGSDFGDTRESSYVELAGSRLTSSGYISWSDKEIKVTLPSNVQDGLVIVGTSSGISEPSFFANKSGIPIAVRSDPNTTTPVIKEIFPSNAAVGQLITITGSNFGSLRGTSSVLFSTKRENTAANKNANSLTYASDDSEYISASETEYDYELWSDTEIHVRVPDGAATGSLFVKTSKGTSDYENFNVSTNAGTKSYTSRRIYVMQLSADVTAGILEEDASITLYIPRPQISSMQPSAEVSEFYPDPLIKNDPRDYIYQSSLNSLPNGKERFSQNFVITVYQVNSQIKEANIARFTNTNRLLYTTYTQADSSIPSNSATISALKDKIIGKQRNPYNQAKLIYNYILENYTLLSKPREGNVSIMDLPEKKKGDAYDFTMLFVTLCRNAGIPAVPISGVLVENGSTTKTHWWAEIYFENFGWFPVDIALGAGASFNSFTQIEDPKTYYFGNMDSQHIAISRGFNQIKGSLLNSKTVYRPRTYALQSIWEETSSSNANYSSLWNNPVILGIY